MEVRFRKGKAGRACSWTAFRRKRIRVPGPTMAAGGDIPHDLYTFVIERELGLRHGFWGCVSEGATFRTLGRKRTEPGRAVIRRHVGDLDEAESRVNDVYFTWRAGGDTPVNAALDEMLARWRDLDEGEELVLNWPDR
ncbi:MAG TPA: hypothetical protein VFS16_00790 [Acidimicrobiia bacterium]|nr:hypothetical protein [Acidimicrobiia bacterium]